MDIVDAFSSPTLTPDQIEIFSIGTGNAPFELSRPKVFGGLLAWREVVKAAMFLTTDNATAQAKLLLGPRRCLRLEPAGADALVELDDYDGAFARLPALGQQEFATNRDAIAPFFSQTVLPRERHYS